MPIPTARVVWYVTGRFYEDEHGLLQDPHRGYRSAMNAG